MNDSDFEMFRHWALTSVEAVGRRFTHPDEDWLPVLLLLTPRGGVLAGIDLAFYQSDARKEVLVKRLSALIVGAHATAFALVQEMWRSWAVTPEGGEPGARSRALRSGRLRPRDDPQREETLLIHITDDVHEELWSAVILRDPHRPPCLGRWEKIDLKTSPGRMTGRFMEPLRAALERARASNN